MEHYTSGSPRVHNCCDLAGIFRATEEYERRGVDGTLPPELASDLLRCAVDLREEVKLREEERKAYGFTHTPAPTAGQKEE